MILLLFKRKNLSDDLLISKNQQPGDLLELQYKLSLNKEKEFVVKDKQLALDLKFVLQSLEPCDILKVRDEMFAFGKHHTQWQLLEELFSKVNDGELELKALVKTFTAEAVFREIGQALANGNYHQI